MLLEPEKRSCIMYYETAGYCITKNACRNTKCQFKQSWLSSLWHCRERERERERERGREREREREREIYVYDGHIQPVDLLFFVVNVLCKKNISKGPQTKSEWTICLKVERNDYILIVLLIVLIVYFSTIQNKCFALAEWFERLVSPC